MDDFNSGIIKEFRANQGNVGGMFSGLKLLLLHTVGAKSGTAYIHPVAYTMDGDRFVIVASKGGAPTNPSWYHNLLAHPDTKIEIGTDTIAVHATDTTGAERERLYEQHAHEYLQFNDYKAKTERQIPVIVLERA